MTDQPIQPAQKSLSRRAVLRTAAWSTPVIAVAIAAPAAAASIRPAPAGAAVVKVQSVTIWGSNGQYSDHTLYGNLNVQHMGAGPAVTSFTLTLSGPATFLADQNASVASGTDARWTYVSRSLASGGTRVYTFAYSGSLTYGGDTTPNLNFTAPFVPGASGSLTISATIATSTPNVARAGLSTTQSISG